MVWGTPHHPVPLLLEQHPNFVPRNHCSPSRQLASPSWDMVPSQVGQERGRSWGQPTPTPRCPVVLLSRPEEPGSQVLPQVLPHKSHSGPGLPRLCGCPNDLPVIPAWCRAAPAGTRGCHHATAWAYQGLTLLGREFSTGCTTWPRREVPRWDLGALHGKTQRGSKARPLQETEPRRCQPTHGPVSVCSRQGAGQPQGFTFTPISPPSTPAVTTTMAKHRPTAAFCLQSALCSQAPDPPPNCPNRPRDAHGTCMPTSPR